MSTVYSVTAALPASINRTAWRAPAVGNVGTRAFTAGPSGATAGASTSTAGANGSKSDAARGRGSGDKPRGHRRGETPPPPGSADYTKLPAFDLKDEDIDRLITHDMVRKPENYPVAPEEAEGDYAVEGEATGAETTLPDPTEKVRSAHCCISTHYARILSIFHLFERCATHFPCHPLHSIL
jgi:hypothetical protein